MIRYKKKISFKTNQNDDMFIETDMGQTWRAMPITSSNPVTDWLQRSSQNTLAHWQKDMIKIILDAYQHTLPDIYEKTFCLYHVYKKGQGYQSKNSDVMLMRIPDKNVWFISTQENTWLFEQEYENFTITADMAIDSILEENTRQQLYNWSDSMRGIKPAKVKYSDDDYVKKGIAP